ncbi:hypothetical protein J3F83DRAFT_723262, partial [Trichoderma novae-zelandiae]
MASNRTFYALFLFSFFFTSEAVRLCKRYCFPPEFRPGRKAAQSQAYISVYPTCCSCLAQNVAQGRSPASMYTWVGKY